MINGYDSIQTSRLGNNPAGSAEVQAFINELGVGAEFTSSEVHKHLPHLSGGCVSGALHRLSVDLASIELIGKGLNDEGKYKVFKYKVKEILPLSQRSKPKRNAGDRISGYTNQTREAEMQQPLPAQVRRLASEVMDRLTVLEQLVAEPLKHFTDLELHQELMNRHQLRNQPKEKLHG